MWIQPPYSINFYISFITLHVFTKHSCAFRIAINPEKLLYRFPKHIVLSVKIFEIKERIFKTLVYFDLTCGIIIKSMRVRLKEYQFIYLCWIVNTLIKGLDFVNKSHRPWVAFSFLTFTNTCLSLYLKFERPIFEQPSVGFSYTKRRVVRHFTSQHVLNILWMHRWNIRFRFRLLTSHWTDYTLRFGCYFKSVWYYQFFVGIGMGCRFLFFNFQVCVLMQTNSGPFIITVVFTFKVLNR